MPFINPRDLVRIVSELYEAPFDMLIEAVIGEMRQWADIKDWQTNGAKWGVDENGQKVGSKDFTLSASDLAPTAVGGASISKAHYIFLPMTFALNPADGETAFKRIMNDVRANGSVRVSTWPGYGVEGEGAYPAMVISKLPAETRSMVEDQIGQGGIIYAVDGVPLSDYLVKAIALPGGEGDDESQRFKAWVNPGGDSEGGRGSRSDYAPPWLMKLSGEIEGAIKAGKVKAEISRIKGFEGELILSTPAGDAVLLISKQYAKAAYIFRKKVDIDGNPTDYDVAISAKMVEFMREFKRKPRGEKMRTDLSLDDIEALRRQARGAQDRAEAQPEGKRPPRFKLRDWLTETDNGYVLRRDVRAEDLRRLINGGLNFEDGRIFAESPMEAESSFEHNLNMVLSEEVVMESEQTIQSFLDVMYSPWSMDEKKLFGYLQTLSPAELDDWVSALEIVVEHGEGDRWIHGLTERTLNELQLSQGGMARVQGILIDLQASPVDDPMEGPEEQGVEPESPIEPQEPPKKPDVDDDYNPEGFYR